MPLSAVATFIRSRVAVLMRTDHSVVYADKSKPEIVFKAETTWIDGMPYGPPTMAEETSSNLTREYEINKALGSHEHITTCYGIVHDREHNVIALKLRRASKGNLRHFIEDTPDIPSIAERVDVVVILAESVAYLHSRGVIWGDLSIRNVLVFQDGNLKLCDFASSFLEGVYPEFGNQTYEPRYCPALPESHVYKLSMMQRELYALGSAIYETTSWKRPYEGVEGDIWDIVEGGTMPVIGEDNVAREIITRCWNFGYDSAKAVAEDLRATSGL
jgi:serine/threonine protein kinase